MTILRLPIRCQRDKVACPKCGSMMARKHGSTFQRKKDRELRDKIVELTLEKRRLRCLSCGKVNTFAGRSLRFQKALG